MSNVVRLWKGAVEPAEVAASGNEIRAWKGAVEPAALVVARRGGVRWLVEPDPETRREKVKELKGLIKPRITPKSTAPGPQEPQETLIKTLMAATSAVPAGQQRRLDRLLQQTGISLDELLIILEIS